MKIFDYKSYEEYVKAQVEGNQRKIKNSYVDPISLDKLVGVLFEKYNLSPSQILCHGTRRGLEQEYFINSFKSRGVEVQVTGTEISPTAVDYPNTIQWDFHDVKDEWVNAIDLIYSNSFDHSYKPIACLDAWMSCVSNKGKCVLEYSYDCDTKSGATDPFAATLDEYIEFISEKYVVDEIITNEGLVDKGLTHQGLRYYIIISKK